MLIRLCSPTLAGLKTGNLFTVDIDDREKFNIEVREFNCRLSGKGIRMIPVKYSEGHVLIYLYRPAFLKRDLANEEARRILKKKGYSFRNADLCVAELARHLTKDKSFPHEIGLFLGYPVADVIANNDGASCKDICCIVRGKDSTIGVATVYRMIKALEDIGIIERIDMIKLRREGA